MEVVFYFATVLSGVWTLISLFKKAKTVGVEDVINEIKKGSPIKETQNATVVQSGKGGTESIH